MERPKVSIITPAYNAARFLPQNLSSVAAQTFGAYEHIVIDDGSGDGSSEIVAEAARQDPRVKLLRTGGQYGAWRARNLGIDAATGPLIAFLDADDMWEPSKLELQTAFMAETGAPLSYHSYVIVDETGRPVRTRYVPATVGYYDMLKTCWIGCLTAMYSVTMCGKRYMPKIRMRQDFGLWLDIIKNFGPAQGMAQPLARYRAYPTSMSSNKMRAAWYTWRLFRDVEHLPLRIALPYWTYFYTHAVVERVAARLGRTQDGAL